MRNPLKHVRRHRPGPPTVWPKCNALVDCGWGRILFAQTFEDVDHLVSEIRAEGPEQRDIAMYVTDPHVLIASAPAELFLDPSHTYRLNLATYRGWNRKPAGFFLRRMVADTDADAVNRLYALHRMVPVRPPEHSWKRPPSASSTSTPMPRRRASLMMIRA